MTPNETTATSAATLAPVRHMAEVTDAQLAQYAELIYRRTGIRVPPQKKTLLSNRVRRRLRETGIEGFGAYYDCLKRLPPQDPEWDAFLQEITTHETYLFRDEGHWQWFREVYLPQWSGASTRRLCGAAARDGGRQRTLRIWSAACSTGDEAFTVACCIAAGLPNLGQWQVRILGTDIGIGAVNQAKTGLFRERAMRLVPESYTRRFFSKVAGGDAWQARPVLTNMVSFRQHNLLDPLRERPFDLVLLKNVLIYFAPESKKRVMDNLRSAICPGGLLLSGPAEGITDLVKGYTRLQPWLHQRPQP